MPRIPRTERRGPRESDLLRAIMLDLGRESDTLVLRNNVGRAIHVGPNGDEWTVPYGLGVGSPDLLCVTAGRAWAIEVKMPGKLHPGAGRLPCPLGASRARRDGRAKCHRSARSVDSRAGAAVGFQRRRAAGRKVLVSRSRRPHVPVAREPARVGLRSGGRRLGGMSG